MSVIIIKLGGSLMRSPDLNSWLQSIETASLNSNIIIVPGGGEFADAVRSLQKSLAFDDMTAHQMALLAMCQYGYMLAGINQSLQIVDEFDILYSNLDKNIPQIWLPTSLIKDNSEIAANWDFTSDSIAVWLATKLLASKLILVKSIGLKNANDSTRNGMKDDCFDKGFQRLREAYAGEILVYEKNQYRKLLDLT